MIMFIFGQLCDIMEAETLMINEIITMIVGGGVWI